MNDFGQMKPFAGFTADMERQMYEDMQEEWCKEIQEEYEKYLKDRNEDLFLNTFKSMNWKPYLVFLKTNTKSRWI